MKALFIITSGIALAITMAYALGDKSVYSQSYTIMIKGEAAGTETVTETNGKDGSLISASEHEIFVTDKLDTKRMAFSTQLVLSNATLIPISYNCRYATGSGDSYAVTIKNGQITRLLNKNGRTSEVVVPFEPNMVIFDINVYHQYDYLIRRYDAKKRGRQVFSGFIPVNGSDIPLAVTFLGEEKLETGKAALPANSYRVEFGNRSATVTADQNGRLVRLVIPAQNIEVVRKDLTK
jgi:hypothetical protein